MVVDICREAKQLPLLDKLMKLEAEQEVWSLEGCGLRKRWHIWFWGIFLGGWFSCMWRGHAVIRKKSGYHKPTENNKPEAAALHLSAFKIFKKNTWKNKILIKHSAWFHGSHILFEFSPPKLGKMFTHFWRHIFEMGWFNHQRVFFWRICVVLVCWSSWRLTLFWEQL